MPVTGYQARSAGPRQAGGPPVAAPAAASAAGRAPGPVADSSGRALITALAAIAILSVLSATAARLASSALRSAASWRDAAAALQAAESGLNHALHVLGQGQRPLSLSNPGWLFAGPASYTVRLAYPDTHPRAVAAAADGRVRSSARRSAARIRLEGLPAALFADADPPGAPDGIVAGACRSRLAYPGAGETSAPPEAAPLAGESAGPGWYRKSGNLVVSRALSVAGPATVFVGGDLRLRNGARLRLGPGVTFYVGGRLTAEPDSVIQADGPATFYIGGRVEFMNRARLENSPTTGDTQPVDIIVKGDAGMAVAANAEIGSDGPPNVVLALAARDGAKTGDVTVDAAVLRAGIYAAGASLKLSQAARITGAVVACDIACANGGEGGGGNGGKGGKGGRAGGKAACSATYDLGGTGAVAEPGWYR